MASPRHAAVAAGMMLTGLGTAAGMVGAHELEAYAIGATASDMRACAEGTPPKDSTLCTDLILDVHASLSATSGVESTKKVDDRVQAEIVRLADQKQAQADGLAYDLGHIVFGALTGAGVGVVYANREWFLRQLRKGVAMSSMQSSGQPYPSQT